MNNRTQSISRPRGESLIATHTVLRNTYLLLSLTLLFSAATAVFAMVTNAQPMGFLLSLVGMFGLLFLTMALRNSPWGLVSVFAFTGFIGYMLGPMLNLYIQQFSNGGTLIALALGTTGVAFLGLSAIALTTKKDFSTMGKFLFIGLLVVIVASIANIFFKVPAVYLAISSATVFIACGLILYDTSRIIHNGETNYIMATISLYLDLYLLFVNLLNLFAAFSGRD
ncbi:MAG: Bax inhibitor-1/YccA family protein [Gammaproteobacteria bacterium]